MKFYIDEDSIDSDFVAALQLRNLTVCIPNQIGMIGATDPQQLNWCAENGHVLITQNIGDFHRLHKEFLAQGKSHAGIILMRQQSLTIGGKLRRILKIQNAISNEEMRNRIEFLSNW